MIDDYPNPVTGTSREAAWQNRVRSAGVANRLLDGPNYRVKQLTTGKIIEWDQAGGAGESVTLYRFKSMGLNHINCRTWDGTTEGSSDVFIAKPFKLRFSITTETIRGTTFTYTGFDTTNQSRIATGGGNQETQFITPMYLVNDLIYAMSATTLVTFAGGPVSSVDLNADGRAFGV